MKKYIILLFSMAMVLGISTNEPNGNVVYAASGLLNVSELDNNLTERSKAEFAYEMAQITARVVSAPNTDVKSFKVEFAYANAQITAKIMPIIPSSQRNQFAYELAKITAKILNDENLDIEKSKAEFAYECAQLTTKIITNTDRIATGKTLKVQNDYIVPKPAGKVDNTDKTAAGKPGYIAPETYNGLIDELMQVGNRKDYFDNKVKIDGEIRYHYAFNRGYELWNYDSSAIRTYLGFGTNLNKDWRLNGMLEGTMNLGHYYSKFGLTRLYAVGKVGTSQVTAGSFSYLMAEGNIYDSGFKGVRVDVGAPVKYSLSIGQTELTKQTVIATARYNDFDYNLESGLYHFQKDNGVRTIWTLGGNYNFSNFGLGAMYLGSSLQDANGYVFSLKYGDLKTWRSGTYEIVAKYYNQPQGTYIAHGMNGVGNLMQGNLMQGFRGYGVGTHYTFAKDLVGGLEYYDLTDRVFGRKGRTWWSDVTYYF